MRALGLVLLSSAAGCHCRPDLPDPPDHTDETDTPPHSAQTGDTAVAGPCEVPEIEPNETPATAVPLPMELHACGTFEPAGDLDLWRFELDQDSWLLTRLQASDGSIADPTLLLAAVGDTWAAARSNDPESLDVTLVFPAPAGTYQLTASEEMFRGGERYGYDLVVSETKPPVSWTRTETEPNDAQASAQTVADGDVVFGTMSGNGALPDYDWYEIAIPPGKHTLKLDITAYDEGSSANLTLYLFDDQLHYLPEGCRDGCPANDLGCVECAIEGGIRGVELDPHGEYVSPGGEVVWIQVLENVSREGPANWYVLEIGLEGS